MYMMTQKCDPHIKLSSLSEVRLVSWILLQLNILCSSLVTLYCTKNNYSPVIHHSYVTTTLRVLILLDFIEAEWSIYHHIQYFKEWCFEVYRT